MTVVVAGTACMVAAAGALWWSLRPAPPPIRTTVHSLVPGASAHEQPRVPASIDEAWTVAARRVPRATAELERWLRLTGSSLPALVHQIAVYGGVGGALAGLLVGAAIVGAGPGAALLPGFGVVVAGILTGVALPIHRLRRRAQQARRQVVRAVGTTVDLVVMCLAGGMGVESALQAAAGIGDDPFSRRLAAMVAATATAGAAPWDRLIILGDELGVAELTELGAAIALAGTEGARVRATLAAKAEALRARELAGEETAANTLTERMFLPGVLLLLGFLLFIGYPAVSRILSGL